MQEREVFAKLKSRKLYTFYVSIFVVLLTWVILTAFGVPFIPKVPPPLWPLLYSLLLIAIPVALLRVAKWSFFETTTPAEAIKMLLAAVGVAIVLFWVLQGYLAARLKLELSGQVYKMSAPEHRPGQVYKMSAPEHRLIVVSVRIANIGNSNASVESADLTISPRDSGIPCSKSRLNQSDLLLVPRDGDKSPRAIRLGLDSRYYTIVWGTEETRQIATECPFADYYTLAIDLRVRQAFLNTGQTWRATAAVPVGESIGKSPAWTKEDEKIPNLADPLNSAFRSTSHADEH